MNPNIMNENPLMFFDRAVNAPVSYTHLDVYKRQLVYSPICGK